MAVQLSPVSLDSFALVKQTAIAFRLGHSPCPSATGVVAALLTLEKAAKAQRIHYPFSALAGQWRLCYTKGVRKRKQWGITLGNGFYLPKFAPATIGFEPSSDSLAFRTGSQTIFPRETALSDDAACDEAS